MCQRSERVANDMNSSSECSGESGDSSGSSQHDKTYIDEILGEMKSQFNREETPSATPEDAPQVLEADEKPRIVLLFKKPSAEQSASRRSPRHKPPPMVATVKRSARRRSRDYAESVLQSAIARKEKSYNEASKPQRLTRQLKPTQKILDNLELAKRERGRSRGKPEVAANGVEEAEEAPQKRHKRNNAEAKGKAAALGAKSNPGSGLESDSGSEDNAVRRSRRISSR